MATNQPKVCLYGGGEARNVKRGEHIIPQAIGGNRTISEFCNGRTVCNPCNNGVLSDLDAELCRRSVLSIVAAHELDSFVWQTWDVDHSDGNLLLEAKPSFSGSSMTLFPQMLFKPDGPQLRCDLEQVKRFGRDRFQTVFIEAMLRAFHAFKSGKRNRLSQKRIELNEQLLQRYQYPPRIFTRHNIEEVTNRSSFELQYCHAADKRFALSSLAQWDSSKRFRDSGESIGSGFPVIRSYSDANKTMRALFKLAINLLAASCPNTPVNATGLRPVISIVLGTAPILPRLFVETGFVSPAAVAPINAGNREHSFRLLHIDGAWCIYSSFFGGQMGAVVRFPGPNAEYWRCADVVAPIDSNDWTFRTSSILQPLSCHTEWENPARFLSHASLVNVSASLSVVPGDEAAKRK
jgi:hypothetical protein